MTLEEQQTNRSGFSRRTALKAAAWSVPVIAAATAVPAYAASGDTVDLALAGLPFGDTVSAMSPDKMRQYTIAIGGGFEASNVGAADVAAGSLLTVTFDARLFGEYTPTLGSQDGTPLTPAGDSSTSGDVTTASFLMPALAAGAEPLEIYNRFGVWPGQDAGWYDDVHPFVKTLTPLDATDSDPSNNTLTAEAYYRDTVDAAVSVDWTTATIPNRDDPGAPYTVDVPKTITIESLTPGGTTEQTSFSFFSPDVLSPAEDPAEASTWADGFTDVAIVSALLDGVDVTSELSDESGTGERFFANFWFRDLAIEAGQTLVIEVDVTLRTDPIVGLGGNGGTVVLASMYPDRDETNNRAESPRYDS